MTPNIDRLAKESVRYTRGVCERAGLFALAVVPDYGLLPALALSTQQMRSGFAIPKGMRGFPARLRARGYYTSNNVKTDYNTGNYAEIIKDSWAESSATAHWRKRPDKAQPFFSIFNLMTSHQSRTMVWPYERFQTEVQSKLSPSEIHDPAKVSLPAYYPDTPLIRREVARFYDCVTAMDKEVGAILRQLEDDGLAGKTRSSFFTATTAAGCPATNARCLTAACTCR